MKKSILQTKIPDGWKEAKFIELTSKISDGLHSTPKYVDKSDFYFINGNNLVNDSIYITEDTKHISEEEYKKYRKDLNESTILLSINGTIGNISYYKNEKVVLGKSAAYINCSSSVSKEFIFALLKTSKIRGYYLKELTGSTIKNLSLRSIKNTPVLLPSLSEQKRIVAVLETWDKAIEKIEEKIEIKKKIKKGLIQQLLGGKIRLSGFTDKWESIKLGKLCKISTGKKDVNEGNPHGEYPFFTCAKTHTFSDSYSFDQEAILIAGNGDVGNCIYYKGKFEAYQRTYILSNFNLNAIYIFHYLKLFFQNTINSQKQMGAMPYIKLKMLLDYEINIPKSDEEQMKIANILTTADKELEKLEQNLFYFIEQKKYLLNNLITGVIRTSEDLEVN